jgi:hypothetical protein
LVDIELNLCPFRQFSESPQAERVSAAALDVQTAEHGGPANEFHVGQHLNASAPVRQRYQYRIGAINLVPERAPRHCRP